MVRDVQAPILQLFQVAELDVSAASGLVALPDRLCVIADDEHFLASYDFAGSPLGRVPLFAGVLPEGHAQRKRLKPDLEALVQLPGDRLLALGSGSTDRRCRGALVDPSSGAVRHIELAPLYALLASRIAELNIEGAAVLADRLWLAHRGNGAARQNACIELELDAVEALLAGETELDSGILRAVHEVELGALDDVPLGLTDLAPLPSGELLFCAAAEASPDTYQDGACSGSVVGVLDARARVVRLASVSSPCKLEGLTLGRSPRSSGELWLVADPDDRTRPAPLFHVDDLRNLLA